MDARRATGIMLVETNCTDPAKEQEFNAWYDHEHLPRAMRTGAYYRIVRYVNINPEKGDAKYLAVYETELLDPSKAFEQLIKVNRAEGWKMHPALQPVVGTAHQKLGITFPR